MNTYGPNRDDCGNIGDGLLKSKFHVIDDRTEVLEIETQEVSNTWPPLVPLDAPNLPKLNPDNLPTWAGEYTKYLAAFTETPPELAAGMVLAACATAAARRVSVMVKPGYSEPCNIWVMAALPSGNRKSGVQGAVTSPLLIWEHEQANALQPEILEAASERKTFEARVKELRNKAARTEDAITMKELAAEAAELERTLPEIPRSPQLWTSDATPERLGTLLADHDECMAWLSSEGGIFDTLAGRYSNGIPNLDLILKTHSGDGERVDRGSRPAVYLRCPRLTIGLSPQPEILRGLATKPGFRGRGLLARFLYLIPPSPLGYRALQAEPIPERVTRAYERGLLALLNLPAATDEYGNQKTHVLRFSQQAYSEWQDFARAIEHKMRPGEDFEHFSDWAGKAPGAAARLAGILHAIEHAHGRPWETDITRSTMLAALEIMAVISCHSLAALSFMGADPTMAAARQIWEWIERGKRSSFTVREAFQSLKGTYERVKPIRDALAVLDERGYLEVIEPSRDGPGRPASPLVIVRPDIVDRWR